MSTATLARRGTTNQNARGNTEDRRRRREWLVETYRADVDVLRVTRIGWQGTAVTFNVADTVFRHLAGNLPPRPVIREDYEVVRVPACRCYRCGGLLTVETVTVDRIIPGCKGGTYRRNNIRPACGSCNSETGGALATRKRR